MVLRKRLYWSLLVIVIFSLLTPPALFAEEPVEEVAPPFPSRNFVNVNGSPSEWDTVTDYFGDIHVNGTGASYGRYYLRLDCRPANPIMYVYVQPISGVTLRTGATGWINMNNLTHTANLTGDNNIPPDFTYTTAPGLTTGVEASWPVLFYQGTYDFNVALDATITGLGNVRLNVSGSADTLNTTTTGCTLSVTLNSFTATPQSNLVLLEWETASEIDTVGFNLYRSTSPDETGEKLNAELIPSAAPGSGQGASYTFEDTTGEGGVTYYYHLEDVDMEGTATLHDPTSATYPSAPTAVTLAIFQNAAHEPLWGFGTGVGTLTIAGVAAWRWRHVIRRRNTGSK